MKALDNRFYVKFMQLEIGLLSQNLIGQLVFTYFDTGGNYIGNSW